MNTVTVTYNASPATTNNETVSDIFSNFVCGEFEHGQTFQVEILDQDAIDRIIDGQESCNNYIFEELFSYID